MAFLLSGKEEKACGQKTGGESSCGEGQRVAGEC